MSPKQRLDLILVEKGMIASRQRARALIMAGKVLVDTRCVDKPGTRVDIQADIQIKGEDIPYVSRGGLKLEAALKTLTIDVHGKVCMDVGASTGGFTDCLLQHGASHVYAIDVGYGQLAWPLRRDSRVTVIERTNIRQMSDDRLPHPVDIATIDVSFISLRIVVPRVLVFLKPNGMILALIKPQFEVGKGMVGKGGVVRDQQQQEDVIDSLIAFFKTLSLRCDGVVASPILGPKGNKEYVAALVCDNSVI